MVGAVEARIVLPFDGLHTILDLPLLHHTFIRLFSLSMEVRIIHDKTPIIVIVNPFYMRAKILGSAGDRQVTSSYLEGVLQLAPKQIYTSPVIMNAILISKLYTRN